MELAQIKRLEVLQRPLPAHAVNKWELLRELAVAQKVFDLSHRDLEVLRALFSFYPSNDLDRPEMVVFPSNRTLCERLNGMPCSTMRRHLGKLVASGLVLRKDSPNGKRYVRRGMGGQAFGFDLSPLPRRYPEILAAAEAVRHEAGQVAILRETVSLMRRDLRELLAGCEDPMAKADGDALLTDTARLLRRNLSRDHLLQLRAQLASALDILGKPRIIPSCPTASSSTSDIENEQHQQKQKKDSSESDSGESAQAAIAPRISLQQVLSSCPEIMAYAVDPVLHWHGFVHLAEKVRPMMGICASAWAMAKQTMGVETAAIVLAVILQRFTQIRSPGGYLRSISTLAGKGGLKIGAMLQALPASGQAGSQL